MSIRLNFFPAYIFVWIFIVLHSSLYYLGKNRFYFSLKMCKQLFFNYMYKCKKYMIFFYDLIKALKCSSIKCINIKWKYLFVEKNDHTNNKKKLYWILWSRFFFFALLKVFLLETKKIHYKVHCKDYLLWNSIHSDQRWLQSELLRFTVPPSDLKCHWILIQSSPFLNSNVGGIN